MGFNFGVFAGGAADGYRKQSEDMRKQAEEKRKQKEQDRQDEERAKFDEIMKSTLDEHKEGLRINTDGKAMPKLDPYGAGPAQQGMATDTIISNQIAGKTEDPKSVNSIVARGIGMGEEPQQSSRPLSVAAQGITPVAMMAPKQAEPKYREPDYNDKFNMTDKAYSRLLEAGLFDKAKEIGQFRSAMLAEKLQTDEKARVEAVRAGAIAVKSRNIEAIRSAAKNISQFVPDGMDVNDVQLTPEGKYKISYGNNAPVELDENQLMSTMLWAGDTKTLLEYDNRITQAGLEAARDKQNAKHQDETAANTKAHYDATARHQIAEFGIRKADSDATRAEKKAKEEAAVAYYEETHPGATPKQLEAVRRSIISAVPEENKRNNLKATDGLTRLSEMYGTKNALGEFQFKPEAREKYLAAVVRYENLVKLGVDPMQAAETAYNNNDSPAVTPRAEYDKLPPGSKYTGPDGKTYIKGK